MADSDPHDTPQWLRRLASTYQGVRFGRGLVGKTSYAVVALIPVWLIIVTRVSSDLMLDGALVGSGAFITVGVLWWTGSTQRFAERNPAQAMLDGGELLEYQRFEAQAKGLAPLRDNLLTADPLALPDDASTQMAISSLEIVDQPDV